MAENYRAMSATQLLQQIESAGRTPDLELIRACMDRRLDLTPGLLDLLAAPPDEDWLPDDPRWYAAIHAGHLLIHFREPQAIPIFFRLLRAPENENLVEWFERALAAYGMALLPEAAALLNDHKAPEYSRISMPGTLEEIAAEFPTERAQVQTILRSALPTLDAHGKLVIPKPRPEKPNIVWSFTASSLAKLHDFHSRPQIEALYREGWIDDSVMGDVNDYLNLLLRDEPLSPYPFNIIETYQGLQATAEREREWEAKRQEILAQQEKIKQRSAPVPESDASAETAPSAALETETVTPVSAPTPQTIRRTEPKVGRNDPCPCGSGRKFKHCHGKS